MGAYSLQYYGLKTLLSRLLKNFNITRKKLTKKAIQANEELRMAWLASIGHYRAEQLIFLDETAVNWKSTKRLYGWAHKGKPAIVRERLEKGTRYSALPALTIDGYMCWTLTEGSFTKEHIQTLSNTLCFHDVPLGQ